MRATTKKVVTVTHVRSQLQMRHQCVAGLLGVSERAPLPAGARPALRGRRAPSDRAPPRFLRHTISPESEAPSTPGQCGDGEVTSRAEI